MSKPNITKRDWIKHAALQLATRRRFLCDSAAGVGAYWLATQNIALAAASKTVPRRCRDDTRLQTISAARQERHLPAHGRRAQPTRAVRLQARTKSLRRPGLPPGIARRSTLRLHPRHPAAAWPTISIPPTRPMRRVALRPPASFCRSASTMFASSKRCRPISSTTRRHSSWFTPVSRGFGYPSMGSWVT